MFGSKQHLPHVTIGKSNDMSKSSFVHNLHDLNYHQNGTGRDSYIYENNGGFSVPKAREHSTVGLSTKMFPDVRVRQTVSPKGARATDT